MQKLKKTIIISLGGSLIVPEELDWKFIKNFKTTIEKHIKKGYKFVINLACLCESAVADEAILIE